jgi:hypothetical protein
MLGASNDTDDTATLNTALAAGGRFRGKPGTTYLLTAPLLLKSGTELDMTGCTVQLKASSVCNMVNNTAVSTSARAVSDAAISASSTTLTSASANFTSADVGRSIVVAGAGNSASSLYPLCATIAAVTNGTTVTLSTAAQATVSGTTVTLYDRDHDISIIGGTWDRGSNDGTGNAKHSMLFRRVDRLTIRDLTFKSSAGKYSIYPADVTDVRVSGIVLGTASDGVHIQGPASRVRITGISGTSGDDAVAMGNSDFSFADTFGGVSDVTVDGVSTSCTGGTAQVKLYGVAAAGGTDGAVGASGGASFVDIQVKNLTGSALTGPSVSVSPDAVVDDLLIDGIQVGTSNSAVVTLKTGSGGLIRVLNAGSTNISGGNPTIVTTSSGASIASLHVQGCYLSSSGGNASVATVTSGSTVTRLALLGCRLSAASAAASRLLRVDGTATTVQISMCDSKSGSSGSCISLGSASVTSLVAQGNLHDGSSSGSFLQVQSSSSTLSRAFLSNNIVNNTSFALADLATTTDLYVYGHSSNFGNVLNLRATAVCSVFGDGVLYMTGSPPSTTAGYSLRVNHRAFKLDISKITTKSAGDMAYNTNAALSCGAGLVLTDGTNWKNLFSGATL